MLKKIKEFVDRKKARRKQLAELKQMKKYYELLRTGSAFMDYIYKDLNNKGNKMNRNARRRMSRHLEKTGKFNMEIVQYYKNNIDNILEYVDKQLNKKGKKDGK